MAESEIDKSHAIHSLKMYRFNLYFSSNNTLGYYQYDECRFDVFGDPFGTQNHRETHQRAAVLALDERISAIRQDQTMTTHREDFAQSQPQRRDFECG